MGPRVQRLGVGLRQLAGFLEAFGSHPRPQQKPGAQRFSDGVEAERGNLRRSYPTRSDCPLGGSDTPFRPGRLALFKK
jgi:hypothetical protein